MSDEELIDDTEYNDSMKEFIRRNRKMDEKVKADIFKIIDNPND